MLRPRSNTRNGVLCHRRYFRLRFDATFGLGPHLQPLLSKRHDERRNESHDWTPAQGLGPPLFRCRVYNLQQEFTFSANVHAFNSRVDAVTSSGWRALDGGDWYIMGRPNGQPDGTYQPGCWLSCESSTVQGPGSVSGWHERALWRGMICAPDFQTVQTPGISELAITTCNRVQTPPRLGVGLSFGRDQGRHATLHRPAMLSKSY